MKLYPELIDYIRRERRTRSLWQIRVALLKDGDDVRVSTIRRICLDVPFQRSRPGRSGHFPEVRSRVLAAARAGEKTRWIAQTFGISTGTVWKWSRAAGVPFRRSNRSREFRE